MAHGRNTKKASSEREGLWTLSRLQLRDWDFRPEVLPEDHLIACKLYEFSREFKVLREAVANSRKRNPDFAEKFALRISTASPSKPSPLRLGDALMKSLAQPPQPLAYKFHPQWPQTSFTLLTPKLGQEQPRRVFDYFQEDMGEFVRKLISRPDFLTLPKTLWDQDGKSETVVLTIPWQYNNDLLEKGFAQWLKDNRPQGDSGDHRPKVEPIKRATGAASLPRQLRASLKALGAYRLLACYKGNCQRAKGHVQNGYDVTKVLGKNFAHDSAWTEAKQIAQWGIEQTENFTKDDLSSERLRLKWETDENFRKEWEERVRFYRKAVEPNPD